MAMSFSKTESIYM